MKKAWLAILGRRRLMPRDVMFPVGPTSKNRRDGRAIEQAANLWEYDQIVSRVAFKGDVWVGGRPATAYKSQVWERIFLDIDDRSITRAQTRARAAQEHFEAQYGVLAPAVFTCHKGFHVHIEHDPVHADGNAIRAAVLDNLADSGASPDEQPIRNARAMPRLPYSLASKSPRVFGELLWVVPVDLTWDIKDMVEASRTRAPFDFQIPLAPGLAEDLQPIADAEASRVRRAVDGHTVNPDDDLIQNAIGFTEHLGLRAGDGRRRILRGLYVPALLHVTEGDAQETVRRCQEWITATGADWLEYETHVDNCIQSCLLPDGDIIKPMRLKKFLALNPDVISSRAQNR